MEARRAKRKKLVNVSMAVARDFNVLALEGSKATIEE